MTIGAYIPQSEENKALKARLVELEGVLAQTKDELTVQENSYERILHQKNLSNNRCGKLEKNIAEKDKTIKDQKAQLNKIIAEKDKIIELEKAKVQGEKTAIEVCRKNFSDNIAALKALQEDNEALKARVVELQGFVVLQRRQRREALRLATIIAEKDKAIEGIMNQINGISQRAICCSRDKAFWDEYIEKENTYKARAKSDQLRAYENMTVHEKYSFHQMPSIGECPVCFRDQYTYSEIKKCDSITHPQHGVCAGCIDRMRKDEYRMRDDKYAQNPGKCKCPVCRTWSFWDATVLQDYDFAMDPSAEFLKMENPAAVDVSGVKIGAMQESLLFNQE
tara:strand:+ start:86 stop:1096 length:1011 start_codon:yes stop_codon:yes gene_type:complete